MVRSGRELEQALKVCRSEAKAAFGDDSLYLEKWLEDTRHVEVQVVVDRFGNGVHLGERDCSVQRRHQKILEEAPTPAMSPAARLELADRAIRAVVAAGYENVGTLEFLVDASGDYYFIEINCRIQVEHPVTEMLTGIDLVATQIRIAAGEPLGFSQADVELRGHAIELRINAEDVDHDFRPSAGVVDRYLAPGGPGVRMDSHLFAGYEVPPYYDSLLGKLIVWGRDREASIARARAALEELVDRGHRHEPADPPGAPAQRGLPRREGDDEPARPSRQRGVRRRGRAPVSRGTTPAVLDSMQPCTDRPQGCGPTRQTWGDRSVDRAPGRRHPSWRCP